MYNWRHMPPEQRAEVLKRRQGSGLPWHGPPHRCGESRDYHLDAANYEHRPVLGASLERLVEFEALLLEAFRRSAAVVYAWCVLPNHYHALVHAPEVMALLDELGRLHGRTSRCWNLADSQVGRKCWHRAVERAIRSERHFWATLNYVHHNPVHHGYTTRWQDWPCSSAAAYLSAVGRDVAERNWRAFPVRNYGRGWDAPAM
ncbi:MAG: Transposase IS200 like protein [Lentisphaerae bacterium ADurb.BinA184]|nr:MAG: Transposase IS200 like protein [Lentisphaerae bacterium ADurb.BinA184]